MGIGKKKRWEEQERQKLADLYRYHQKSMMQIAMSILHRKEDAEDAVQNSILAISRHMDKLGDIEDYRTKAYVQLSLIHISQNNCNVFLKNIRKFPNHKAAIRKTK